MNIRELEILNCLIDGSHKTQRSIADACGFSLGTVNASVKKLVTEGFLDTNMGQTEKTAALRDANSPKNAIILAAGYGMRMVPINREVPKGLLEVKGERLIERLIRQLREAGVTKVYVVVGFMKEAYEYLMDEFDVELIVNSQYASTNNIHSLKWALPYLGNSYILPSDLFCRSNPFRKTELYSWYMVSDALSEDSTVAVNRKMEFTAVRDNLPGNKMIGISYLTKTDAAILAQRIQKMCADKQYADAFWETALFDKKRVMLNARVISDADVIEINTYEDLRELDADSNQLKTDAISIICEALGVDMEHIGCIEVLKKGMTNRSFLFRCNGKRYIMRIPGEGTDKLINRKEEAAVYTALKGRNICDNVIYMNPENGYKITEYLEGARVCDPEDPKDIGRCMKKLRSFHEQKLTVDHRFDLFYQIQYYEDLWGGIPSQYKHYADTKANVLSLRPYIDVHAAENCLTHIDAVPDNFLFIGEEENEDAIRLIDWEYAGMQDPHVDIAMFCIYAMYERNQVEALIDAYFPEGCPKETRVKIYCYIAACGLLWSNWCEFKRILGVEFGEYSLRQYRFAKEYYKIVKEEMDAMGYTG